MRAVGRLVRAVAQESGTSRLAVRVRPTSDPHRIVVAYPWRRRERAQEMGRAVGDVLDAVTGADLEEEVSRAAERVAEAEPGASPHTITPKVPVVAVTGTNGKTTTSRMIAHLARTDGRLVGWSNTDGIYVDGRLVEAGDYSGPSGAGRVLAHPGVELAVTETARGGILLKGIGLTRNDVSVVTNVSADHLGLQGIDTVDQLAEVKAVVPHITRKDGWAVLNADDPRVYAMRTVVKAQPWVFGRDPDSPAIRDTLSDGGRATTVIDGWLCVLRPDGDPDPLIELVDVPMTLAGLSRFNVENTLAAASAALAVGIPRDVVVEGLRTFRPDAEHNPGRMNFFTVPILGAGEVTVVVDLAHNEAGLEALIEIMNGVRRPDARLLLGLGVVGDRQDDLIEKLAEIAARDCDVIAIGHKDRYLRGRTIEELDALLRAGAERVGVTGIPAYPTEVACLAALVGQALPGDVVGLMCHAQRQEVYDWIAAEGGTPDSPEDLALKVRAAH
jgi:cyanophycin synthetase